MQIGRLTLARDKQTGAFRYQLVLENAGALPFSIGDRVELTYEAGWVFIAPASEDSVYVRAVTRRSPHSREQVVIACSDFLLDNQVPILHHTWPYEIKLGKEVHVRLNLWQQESRFFQRIEKQERMGIRTDEGVLSVSAAGGLISRLKRAARRRQTTLSGLCRQVLERWLEEYDE